jgi:transcriptional regulator with XRE-family HTH domain
MAASISAPEFSAALVAYLRNQGRNLREIGEMIGLSESFVSRVSNGERSFTIDHLAHFEQALGEPLPALIMQAMWAQDLPPRQQAEFDAALQLLRNLDQFRRSVTEVDQHQTEREDALRVDPASPHHARQRKTHHRKRAAG